MLDTSIPVSLPDREALCIAIGRNQNKLKQVDWRQAFYNAPAVF
jgi:hypothetical protein